MANFVSNVRKIPSKLIKQENVGTGTPMIVKRARILNDKSSFHVKEAYKALRTNIVFAVPHDGAKRIIVTSALAGEGKSTNCLNLAISFAQTGSKVLLVDCDLRKPNIANLLNIQSSPGLSNVLANLNSVDSVIVHSEYPNLDIIPSGDMPPNPAELLGSSAMQETLERLSEIYEYIFLDTSPINLVTDTAVLSKMAHGIVLVVRQGRTDKESVAESIKKLSFVNANIIGFVLNGRLTDIKISQRYGKGGYYQYGRGRRYGKNYYGYGYGRGYGYGYAYSGKGSYGYTNSSDQASEDSKKDNK